MALPAIPVQDRLDVPVVTDGRIRPRRRVDLPRVFHQGDRFAGDVRRLAVQFVTTEAPSLFTRLHPDETPHRLKGQVVFVEQLKMQGRSGRRLERHGTVRLDGNGADNPFDPLRLNHGDDRTGRQIRPLVPVGVGLRFDVHDAEELRLVAEDLRGAEIDVSTIACQNAIYSLSGLDQNGLPVSNITSAPATLNSGTNTITGNFVTDPNAHTIILYITVFCEEVCTGELEIDLPDCPGNKGSAKLANYTMAEKDDNTYLVSARKPLIFRKKSQNIIYYYAQIINR